MSASLAVLGEGFDARACPPRNEPLAVNIRDEAELLGIERTPDSIDDVFEPDVQVIADCSSTAQKDSRIRMLDVVEQAVKEVNPTEQLSPTTPFYLKAVVMPDVHLLFHC
jgi:hypothetical protein